MSRVENFEPGWVLFLFLGGCSVASACLPAGRLLAMTESHDYYSCFRNDGITRLFVVSVEHAAIKCFIAGGAVSIV